MWDANAVIQIHAVNGIPEVGLIGYPRTLNITGRISFRNGTDANRFVEALPVSFGALEPNCMIVVEEAAHVRQADLNVVQQLAHGEDHNPLFFNFPHAPVFGAANPNPVNDPDEGAADAVINNLGEDAIFQVLGAPDQGAADDDDPNLVINNVQQHAGDVVEEVANDPVGDAHDEDPNLVVNNVQQHALSANKGAAHDEDPKPVKKYPPRNKRRSQQKGGGAKGQKTQNSEVLDWEAAATTEKIEISHFERKEKETVTEGEGMPKPSRPKGDASSRASASTEASVQVQPRELSKGLKFVTCTSLDEISTFLRKNISSADLDLCPTPSVSYLSWYLQAPGSKPEWLLGVRSKHTKMLVGFIAAVPVNICVEGEIVSAARITLLCVKPTFRNRKMASSLKREITKRVKLDEGVKHAIYSCEIIPQSSPKPFRSFKAWCACISVEDLIEFGFCTEEDMKSLLEVCKLPSYEPVSGFRKMEGNDVRGVTKLLNDYNKGKYRVSDIFTEETVTHWLLPKENFVHSFVVQRAEAGPLTDFISFQIGEYNTTKNPRDRTWKAATLLYSATNTTTLQQLASQLLAVFEREGISTFGFHDQMEHSSCRTLSLKFTQGSSETHLFIEPLPKVVDDLKPEDWGIVLLGWC